MLFSYAFFSLVFFSSRSDFLWKLQLPDSWWFVCLEIWCTGTPEQLCNGVSTQKKNLSVGQLYSPKIRSWRRRENIWSRGWRRRTSRLGLGSVSCPLFAGVFTGTVKPRWLLLQNSPQIQPHPADTQPPCESERRGSFAALQGCQAG